MNRIVYTVNGFKLFSSHFYIFTRGHFVLANACHASYIICPSLPLTLLLPDLWIELTTSREAGMLLPKLQTTNINNSTFQKFRQKLLNQNSKYRNITFCLNCERIKLKLAINRKKSVLTKWAKIVIIIINRFQSLLHFLHSLLVKLLSHYR